MAIASCFSVITHSFNFDTIKRALNARWYTSIACLLFLTFSLIAFDMSDWYWGAIIFLSSFLARVFLLY